MKKIICALLFSTWCAMALSADEPMIPPTDPIPWGEVKADLRTAIVDDSGDVDLVGIEFTYISDSFVIDSKGFKYDGIVGILVVDCKHKQYALVDGTYFFENKVVYVLKHGKDFVKPSSPVGEQVGYELCRLLRV